jgi:hypothetical protein
MGVIAYEVSTGHLPSAPGRLELFDARGKSLDRDLRDVGVPADAANLIVRMLSVVPHRRPQTARFVALNLQAALAGMQTA